MRKTTIGYRITGMEEGINNWLNYLNQNFRLEFGQDWDQGGTIRAGIKTDLAMISGANTGEMTRANGNTRNRIGQSL